MVDNQIRKAPVEEKRATARGFSASNGQARGLRLAEAFCPLGRRDDEKVSDFAIEGLADSREGGVANCSCAVVLENGQIDDAYSYELA